MKFPSRQRSLRVTGQLPHRPVVRFVLVLFWVESCKAKGAALWMERGHRSLLPRDQPIHQTCNIKKTSSCHGVCLQCVDVCMEKIDDSQMNLTLCCEGEKLCIKESCLKAFPQALVSCRNLKVLDLSNNRIPEIKEEHLAEMTELLALDLSYNRLRKLEAGTFDPVTKIEEIYLNNNLISKIAPNAFLTHLTRLRILDLSENVLVSVDIWFLRLPSAEYFRGGRAPVIDLSLNMIEKVTNELGATFKNVNEDDSVFVSLRQNKLKYMANFNVVDLLNVTRWPELLHMRNMIVDVRNNPLHCDCDVYELLHFARQLSLWVEQMNIGQYLELVCETPSDLNGWLASYVPKDRFHCPVLEGCPEHCNCTKTASNDTLTVVCPHWPSPCMPDQLPRSANIELYMGSNKLESLSDRAYLSNTTILDLSNNRLQQVDKVAWYKMNRTRRLLLSGNRIEEFHKNFGGQKFSSLEQLSVNGNPLRCDCNNSWFKQWLRDHFKVVDKVGDLKCLIQDTPWLNASFESCVTKWMFPMDYVCVVLLVVVSSVLIGLWFKRYSFYLKYIWYCFLWRNTNRYLRQVRNSDEWEYEYDVMLSYSAKDAVVVNKSLLKKLEVKYQVCVRGRDVMSGTTVLENIVTAVGKSQQTVVVLSKNFLADSWCQVEMHMSRLHAQEADRGDLVVVVLDHADLLGLAVNNRTLHDHIVKRGCLYLHQPDFWNKLIGRLKMNESVRQLPTVKHYDSGYFDPGLLAQEELLVA